MARDPKEFKGREGRPYLVKTETVDATNILQQGKSILPFKWE